MRYLCVVAALASFAFGALLTYVGIMISIGEWKASGDALAVTGLMLAPTLAVYWWAVKHVSQPLSAVPAYVFSVSGIIFVGLGCYMLLTG